MNLRLKKSITLIELLIAMALLGLIILGFASLDLFSRYHVLTSDRRAKLQNEATYVLEHMTKAISGAIGSRGISGQNPVSITNIGGDPAIIVWIDYYQDGKLIVSPGPTQDRQIAYSWRGSPDYQARYYSNYTGAPSSYEVLSQRIPTSFIPSSVTDNYIDVSITTRWQPGQGPSVDNPEITMRTRIKMPSVSTN